MLKVVVLTCVLSTGIIYSLIGSLKLELARKLAVNDIKVGGLVSMLMVSSLGGVLVLGPMVDFFGHKPLAVTGFLLAFVSVLWLISAKSFRSALFSCLVLGIGGMCLNTVGNTLLPSVLFSGKNAPAALNLGTAFYGIGSFATPLFVGLFVRRMGFKLTGNILAIGMLVPVAFAFLALYPALGGMVTIATAFRSLTSPLVIFPSIAFFFYLGLEVSMASWLTTYGNSLGFTDRLSNVLLSIFYLCLIIARVIAATSIETSVSGMVICGLALISFITIGLITMTETKGLAIVLVVITGLALGPIFPTIVGIALSSADLSIRGTIFSAVFASGLLGASIIPMLIGVVSERRNIRESLRLAMASAFFVSVMGALIHKI